MTTQLPNGYEAVKVPEGAGSFFIHLSRSELKFDWGNDTLKIPGKYFVLGRADELTEEQWFEIMKDTWHMPEQSRNIKEATRSAHMLLASLHLEPHTTIILKKENV